MNFVTKKIISPNVSIPVLVEIETIEINIPFNKSRFKKYLPHMVFESLNFDDNSRITLFISAKDGKILNFNENISFNISIKIDDEGIYKLIDKNNNILKEYLECYVPNFIPNEYMDYYVSNTEYGNFFIFNVKNGYLLNWQGNKEIIGYVDHFVRKDNFEID